MIYYLHGTTKGHTYWNYMIFSIVILSKFYQQKGLIRLSVVAQLSFLDLDDFTFY